MYKWPMPKGLPQWLYSRYKTTNKACEYFVRLQSSHLPQVIKPRLQVIIYSTIRLACGFSLSRNFSRCDRFSNCRGRSLDKLVYGRKKISIAYQYHPSIYKPEYSISGSIYKPEYPFLPLSWHQCQFHQGLGSLALLSLPPPRRPPMHHQWHHSSLH